MWEGKSLCLISKEKELLFIDLSTRSLSAELNDKATNEETIAIAPTENDFGKGLYITRALERQTGGLDYFLIFKRFDIKQSELQAYRKVRYPAGTSEHFCISKSLNSILYIANNSIIKAVLDPTVKN